MNPLAIHATNLRTFERLDLDLPTGCVVIGGANGAGKSTILNAIDVALFAGRGELAQLLSLGEDELTLELEFEHAGELYRVRRTFKGRKTTLDLERDDHDAEGGLGGWNPLTRETAEQTQKHLEQLLGLSRATFRASSFLAQGDGAAFTDAQPRDRKAMLAEILGLGVYDKLLDRARGELRAVEDELLRSSTAIAQLDTVLEDRASIDVDLLHARDDLAGDLGRLGDYAAALERAVQAQAANAAAVERVRAAYTAQAAAEERQEAARQLYAAAVQAGADRVQRQAELDAAAAQAGKVSALEAELAQARNQMARTDRRRQLEREAEQRDLARERLFQQAATARQDSAALAAKAAHLDAHIDESAACDRCGQTLGAEAAARAAESYRTDARAAIERANQIEQANVAELAGIAELLEQAAAIPNIFVDLGVLDGLLATARAAGELRATLAEQVRQLAELAATEDPCAVALADATVAVTVAAERLASAREGVADEAELTRQVGDARLLADTARAKVDEQRASVVRLEERQTQMVAAAAESERLAADVETISKRVDVLKLAERAFGRNGIPALIVENAAIPQLELEANRILGELGGNTAGSRVELRTQRALKSTEALRETLDIVILTPAGERAYESFSGGERTRLNLALRIALARLLAHRRGAESRLLAIDEPDGLDQAGMQALANVLRGVGGDFERILLVSHHPDFATEFEQSILVVNDGDRSRVDTGDVAVAA